jgi:hypothetical protein
VPGGRGIPAVSAAHERNERSAGGRARKSRAERDPVKATSPKHRHRNEPQRPWQIGH